MINEAPGIAVLKNGCDGRPLAPSESCDIEVALHIDKLQGQRVEDEVPISLDGVPIVENTLWLNVRDRNLRAFTTNR